MFLDVDPKVDYAFKYVFGVQKNADILIHLINAVLARSLADPIVAVEIRNPFSTKDALDDKLCVLDIKARDSTGRWFNIEMQMLAPDNVVNRFLYYWAGVYRDQLKEGDDYGELRPTISILFLNDKLFKGTTAYHLTFQIVDQDNGIVFSDQLQMHTMELPKFNLTVDQLSGPLDVWCYFFAPRKFARP